MSAASSPFGEKGDGQQKPTSRMAKVASLSFYAERFRDNGVFKKNGFLYHESAMIGGGAFKSSPLGMKKPLSSGVDGIS